MIYARDENELRKKYGLTLDKNGYLQVVHHPRIESPTVGDLTEKAVRQSPTRLPTNGKSEDKTVSPPRINLPTVGNIKELVAEAKERRAALAKHAKEVDQATRYLTAG